MAVMTKTVRWRTTATEVPKHREPVLMATHEGKVVVGWYGDWDKQWRTCVYICLCDPPKYWAELPAQP